MDVIEFLGALFQVPSLIRLAIETVQYEIRAIRGNSAFCIQDIVVVQARSDVVGSIIVRFKIPLLSTGAVRALELNVLSVVHDAILHLNTIEGVCGNVDVIIAFVQRS